MPSRVAETISIGMVCVAPWMFGSVDAWAELILEVGAGLVAILAVLAPGSSIGRKNFLSLPSLGLGGLVLLALLQASPLPVRLLQTLEPRTAELRASLAPNVPERVQGDTEAPVNLPPPTISHEPAATLDTAARLAAVWLLFQGVMALAGGIDALRRAGQALALNATALALFALVQALTWNGKIYWYFPSPSSTGWSTGGPFVCHSHLAEVLNLALALTLGVLLAEGRRDRTGVGFDRFWAAYLAGVLMLGILTSHSRGGFLAMLTMTLVMAVCLRGRASSILGMLAGVALILVLFLGSLGDASPYSQRLKTILDFSDNGYSSRFEVWKAGLYAFGAHPLWGSGLGSFGSSLIPFQSQDRQTYFAHAEDEYVELLVEGGLVGAALALTFLAGVAVSTRRAIARTNSPADRALLIGAATGIGAILVQCVSDFGLHVAGVAVPFIVICGHLCGLGSRETHVPEPAAGQATRRRIVWATALTVITLAVVCRGVALARVEAYVSAANLPPPASELPTPGLAGWPREELEKARSFLRQALHIKPDWAEGHVRLGLVELALYRSNALEWLEGSSSDPAEREQLADPTWLTAVAREAPGGPASLVVHGPIRDHLVPAARSFLAARRSCLVSGLAHAELGALAFLLEPDPRPEAHLHRVLSTAGPNTELLIYSAHIANLSGDSDTAVQCWRRALQSGAPGWRVIADEAGDTLSADRILTDVIPADSGRFVMEFADYLYASPESRPTRERFLREAVRRIPMDPWLLPAERHALEARPRAELGDRAGCKRAMSAALAMEPGRLEWRKQFIDWLLSWNEAEEAHAQALAALELSSDRREATALLEETAEALVRESQSPGSR